jgi:signal transduction histidine kinase
MDAPALHAPPQVDALMLAAASRAEAVLSLVRIPFAVGLLVRYIAMGAPWDGAPHAVTRTAAEITLTALAVGLSTFFLAHVLRHGRLSWPWLVVSVIVDTTVGMSLLASNSLFPGDAYRGILSGHDLAAALVLVAAAALRLSVPIVLLAAAIVTAGIIGILALDVTLCPVPVRNTPDEAVWWVVLLGAVTVVGALTAGRTRALVRTSAARATRLAAARQVVEALRGVHHDAHSALTALQLTAERILSGPVDPGARAALEGQLRSQSAHLAATLRSVRETASGELLVDTPVATGPVVPALEDAIGVVRRLFPELAVDAEAVPSGLAVRVRGGRAGLSRAFINLLINAAQGDGTRGATRVRVHGTAGEDEVRLILEDDGPGLGSGPKPGGHAIGLSVVRAIVGGAGGRVALEDHAGGARILLDLPRATAATPDDPETPGRTDPEAAPLRP